MKRELAALGMSAAFVVALGSCGDAGALAGAPPTAAVADPACLAAVAPAASLVGCNLSQADLAGADLYKTGARLKEARAYNAMFTGAVLVNADLTNAVGLTADALTGVIWGNTTCPDETKSDDVGGTCLGHLTPASPPPAS